LRQGGHYEHNNQEGCKAAGHERRNHSTCAVYKLIGCVRSGALCSEGNSKRKL
jgi:hypothetical protein